MDNNFSNRFPQIVAALTVLPVRSCLIDDEAVVCDENGLAVFDLIRGWATETGKRHDVLQAEEHGRCALVARRP